MNRSEIGFQNVKITYYSEGECFPLVFLHGFCEDHSVWSDLIKSFSGKNRIILPDNPGFGGSSLPASSVNMDFYADAVKAILDHEKIGSCKMIGHSMGGYITLNFASRYPEYLRSFGLFHSSAYEDDESKKRDRERVAAFVKTNGSESFIKELYNKLFAQPFMSTHQGEINSLAEEAIKTSPVDGIAAASLAMRDRKDTTAAIKNSSGPVLFIIGKEDKTIPAEKMLQQSHLPNRSVICLLDGVGHMGMIEDPSKCRAAIEEWLGLE